MTLPRHVDPTSDDRRAHAPYNFVPLPDVIVPAQPLPDRDRYHPNRYTGVIHCTLTTETPLYTRAALEPHEYGYVEAKNKEEFFYVDPVSRQPVIPGSSLRGMLRSLVEIITYSKLQPVTDRQLFFRTLDVSSVGDAYRRRMVGGDRSAQGAFPLAQAGYIELRNHSYYLRPAQTLEGTQHFRVEQEVARNVIPELREMATQGSDGKWRPNKGYFWLRKPVWFKPTPPMSHKPESASFFAEVTELSTQQPAVVDGWVQGWFIASGWVPSRGGGRGKHRHWIIAPPVEDDSLEIRLDDADVDAYRERGAGLTDAITGGRINMSVLPDREGERRPCFYITWQDSAGQIRYAFGHTAMFRIPYEWSPRDLLPDHLRDSEVTDMAEAIFGWVDDGKGRQIAGRVYVGDAHVSSVTGRLWVRDPQELPVRSLLSGPKPTTFQHYLTQSTDDPLRLNSYADRGKATLRGHKLYWHKNDRLQLGDYHDANATPSSTQHTSLYPVDKGVTFSFDVRFENLSAEELGALLWPLIIGGQSGQRLKVGMGKPLGLGTVRTTADLHLSKRRERYGDLFAEWDTEPASDEIASFTTAFESAIWDALPEQARGEARNFRGLERIRALMALLHWPGPDVDATHYMTLSEFKPRPVLPTPAEVMRLAPPRPLPRTPRAEATPLEEFIAESTVLAVKEKGVEIKLESGERLVLSFEELPERVNNRWHAERLFPRGSEIRVKVRRAATGKLLVTGKGVPQ